MKNRLRFRDSVLELLDAKPEEALQESELTSNTEVDDQVDHQFFKEPDGSFVLSKVCNNYYKKRNSSNLRKKGRKQSKLKDKNILNADLLFTVMETKDPAIEETVGKKKFKDR